MNHQTGDNDEDTIKLGLALAALSHRAPALRPRRSTAHETFSAGEPGNPKKPARTIEIAA